MVLSGMSNMEQLLDNTDYMRHFTPLNEEERKIVERAVHFINGSITIPCTACGYCVEGCPKHIPIPQYFAWYNEAMRRKTPAGPLHDEIQGQGKASDCIGCKQCERQCPQHIAIAENLKRIAELDRIFKRIYEDDINGTISHERFLKLSAEYEAEQ